MDCKVKDFVGGLRAKQMAENKIQSGDFVGGLKFAKKAQRLYPETENIAKIIAVCEVHCAAQNKLPTSEMDWYGILQTEKFSEEATIIKQYKKLALLLHPDKNKYAGAEAAFKLIEEAKRLLSDQTHRTQNLNQPDAEKTFLTFCEHCNTRYKYYKNYENANMHCQVCAKYFTARDMEYQPSDGSSSSKVRKSKDGQRAVGMRKAGAGTSTNVGSKRAR